MLPVARQRRRMTPPCRLRLSRQFITYASVGNACAKPARIAPRHPLAFLLSPRRPYQDTAAGTNTNVGPKLNPWTNLAFTCATLAFRAAGQQQGRPASIDTDEQRSGCLPLFKTGFFQDRTASMRSPDADLAPTQHSGLT